MKEDFISQNYVLDMDDKSTYKLLEIIADRECFILTNERELGLAKKMLLRSITYN